MKLLLHCLILLGLLGACSPKAPLATIPVATTSAAPAESGAELRIAFGSCSRQNLPQPLWADIARDQPDVWMWLGDNIYGDSDDPAVLRAKYATQFNNPGYRQLREQGTRIIGTWDDHDYGRNDGDKNYPFKAQNQQLALDFLEEPADSPRRRQEGIYAAYEYRVAGKKVKVLLLDDRYFQDPLYRDAQKVYQPNPTGDVLGEAQWAWLRAQLAGSDADAHIIGSGIQFLPTQHPYEKWSNFPAARQRLLNLFSETQPKGLLLVSGDRHIGEVSELAVPGLARPVLEVTSSGLTHPATQNTGEPNALRVGPLVNQKHYALFRFRAPEGRLLLDMSLRGEADRVFYEQAIRLE
ncbi:alkaline phosphatase D family protein [Hymenobacter terrestris]|uniref:Alkaline phosphatase family protein n=1 Tax=Hymenobacter terrestris TaxID=2748310 RepID=A0ABX2Q2R3_9BACT|nr:alkaline phosphatase D family protein [Hymenobacter terrestris]NVO84716.1 alkaline phosphatase family protein [Hymenobacter terrestris]